MIYYTNPDFNALDRNPFCGDQPYDGSWVMVQLLDCADFNSFTGNGGHNLFRLILTKQTREWRYRLMDFLQYETKHHKNIIAAIHGEDLKEAEACYEGHSYTDCFLRDYESPVLIHSTTAKAYKQIMECGYLKSWNMLHKNDSKGIVPPIGTLLGDPEDYSDYVMFHQGGYFSELVIASKEKCCIDSDVHAVYTAGARFYFDGEKIAKDGLLVRDGAHLKVENTLQLEKYLLWTATPEKVGVPAQTTPYEFGTRADDMFQQKFGIKL